MNGLLHALAALSPAKEPSIPIDYAAGWEPEPLLSFLKKEISLDPVGDRNLYCPTIRLQQRN
jgi:hypothetical protein